MDRYGVFRKKIYANMKLFSRSLQEYNINATIFIPSSILSRNSDILDAIDLDRIEIALHGRDHIDYTNLSSEEISCHIKTAIETFKDYQIKAFGFRAPYLKINNNVLKAINNSGMIYDSSYPVYFDTIPKDSAKYPLVERLIKLYDMRFGFPKISKINQLKEIPVALPDDEILVERLDYNKEQVSRCWIDSMKISKNTEEGIFVLQLHPERIALLKESLIDTIQWAANNGVTIKSLADIARTGIRPGEHCMAITGDIDIVKLLDIMRG